VFKADSSPCQTSLWVLQRVSQSENSGLPPPEGSWLLTSVPSASPSDDTPPAYFCFGCLILSRKPSEQRIFKNTCLHSWPSLTPSCPHGLISTGGTKALPPGDWLEPRPVTLDPLRSRPNASPFSILTAGGEYQALQMIPAKRLQ